MAEIYLPPPENLSLAPEVRTGLVTDDMYDICERVKEVSPDLKIIHLTDPSGDEDKQSYVIMETGKDGKEYFVMKTKELDGRVIEHLRYLLHVPFEDRIKTMEKANAEFEAAEHERELDELYDRVGRPMWTELEKTGFMTRSVSYPKRPKRRDRPKT